MIIGTNAVVKHAVQWLKQSKDVQYACRIYATAPFVQPKYLREGVEKLLASEKLFTFPNQSAIRINNQEAVEAFFPEDSFTRSQYLEEAYHDAGQFCWGRTEVFLNDVAAYPPPSLPIILPRDLVQDIDAMEDSRRDELMFQIWKQGEYE